MKWKQSTTKFKQKGILLRLRIDFCLLSLSVHSNCVWLPQTWYVPELDGIFILKTLAAHLQPAVHFFPPFTARLSLTFTSNTAIRRRGRLPVWYASLGNHGRAPRAAKRFHPTHVRRIFPLVFFRDGRRCCWNAGDLPHSFQPAAAICRGFYLKAFRVYL